MTKVYRLGAQNEALIAIIKLSNCWFRPAFLLPGTQLIISQENQSTAPCSSLQLKPLKRDSLREQWACVSSLIFSARTVKAHTLRSNSSDLGINHTGFEDDPLIAAMGPFCFGEDESGVS